MELVLAIGQAGFRVAPDRAHDLVYGYACGLDLTRRDLQLAAREKGRPWDLGKEFENAAVISEIAPMPGVVLERGFIKLFVNGELRQKSDLGKLIWNVREIIADLSQLYHLVPGDLVFTGTPEGVGPVKPGDRLEGKIEGVGTIALTIGPAESRGGADPRLQSQRPRRAISEAISAVQPVWCEAPSPLPVSPWKYS